MEQACSVKTLALGKRRTKLTRKGLDAQLRPKFVEMFMRTPFFNF